jgi:hypothetical protein
MISTAADPIPQTGGMEQGVITSLPDPGTWPAQTIAAWLQREMQFLQKKEITLSLEGHKQPT